MKDGGQARLLGRWGEALAAQALRQKGWRILAQGYRCRFGEIDLIAENGTFIAFVEVKLRKNGAYGEPRAFVDQRKQERIRTTAALYLQEQETALQPRFDVVEIYAPQGTKTPQPELYWLENAF